jgi:hypothetical protein
MRVLRSVLSSFVLGGCLLAAGNPVQAALIASSSVSYDEGFGTGFVTIQGPTINGGGTSTVGYSSGAVPGLATSGSATAVYGALHADAFSGIANPGFGFRSQTNGVADAFWSDQLMFSSATLSGAAFARAVFSLSGGLDSIADLVAAANSTVAAKVQVNGSTMFSTTGQVMNQAGAITTSLTRGVSVNGVVDTVNVSDLAGSFVFDIPFVFNVGFTMSGSLDAQTRAQTNVSGATANAHSNFGSSGLWGGITEVHLADGTVLTGFSLGSTSGFDWMSAFPTAPGPIDPGTVPVPATLWLFGAGLLALIGTRRRKAA